MWNILRILTKTNQNFVSQPLFVSKGWKYKRYAIFWKSESKFPFSGCTVHWVDEGVDTGPIIDQRVVPVLKGDDEEKLSSRILKEEHKLYPSVVKKIADGDFVPFFMEEK